MFNKNFLVKRFKNELEGKPIEIYDVDEFSNGICRIAYSVNNTEEGDVIRGTKAEVIKEFEQVLDSFVKIPAMNKGLNFPKKFYYKGEICACEGSNTYAYIITLDTREKLYVVNDTEKTAFAHIYNLVKEEEGNFTEGRTEWVYPVQ